MKTIPLLCLILILSGCEGQEEYDWNWTLIELQTVSGEIVHLNCPEYKYKSSGLFGSHGRECYLVKRERED